MAKLRDRMNARDAAGMAALFATEYRSEQPDYPHRGFDGHAQVAVNWSQMFDGVPDLASERVAETTDGSPAGPIGSGVGTTPTGRSSRRAASGSAG